MTDQPARAKDEIQRALAIARQLNQDKAIAHFEELLKAMESPKREASPLMQRIHEALQHAKQDPAAAFQALAQIADEAQKADAVAEEASARFSLAQVLLAQGEHALAALEARRALTLAERAGDQRAIRFVTQLLATASSSRES